MSKKNKNKNRVPVAVPTIERTTALPMVLGGDFDSAANDIQKYQAMIDRAPKTDKKRRVLFVCEASYLRTGFSTYLHEVFTRLHKTGKYELAELGCYGDRADFDARVKNIPWKYYHNLPVDRAEEQEYGFMDGHPVHDGYRDNQFGKWKFDKVVADFKPDIVITVRDWWMDQYIKNSLFRDKFVWFWMPTVDGYPQRWEWLKDYKTVDKIFTYSHFGKKVLETQSTSLMAKMGKVEPVKVIDVCQPGADPDVFQPLNKKEVRKIFGLPENIRFVGTVMRNQPRKLFPRIIESFARFRKEYPKEAQNVFLLLHTSIPDVGWDIPSIAVQNGVQDFILYTYLCVKCGNIAISAFRGSPSNCPVCNAENTFITPNTKFGVDPKQLNLIYNLMDVYIQGSIAEGCFAKGTKITTLNGIKNIEDIIIGDKVLTHSGQWKPVVKTFTNPPSANVYDMRTFGDLQVNRTTGNHKILAAKIIKSKDKWGRERIQLTGDTEWRDQSTLKRGDWAAYKFNNKVEDIDYLDVAKYSSKCRVDGDKVFSMTPRYYVQGKKTLLTPKILIDNDLLYMLGLFLAEGSTTNGWVTLSSNIKESFLEKISPFIQNTFGRRFSIRLKSDTNGKEASFYSPVIAEMLENMMGKGSRNKRIPEWVMTLPLEKQTYFIRGYYEGDGLKTSNKEKSITTASVTLAYQIRDLLLRHGICSSVNYPKKREEYIVRVKEIESFNRFNTVLGLTQQRTAKSNNSQVMKIINDTFFVRVRSVVKVNHKEQNYDLQVKDDHSYSLTSYNVHNCGMPVLEAKMAGVPCLVSDYSALYEKARNGGALPILNETIYTEHETHQWRSLFDRKDLAKKLALLLGSESRRQRFAQEARECAVRFYNWDLCAKKWEAYIDNETILDRSKTWDAPVEIKKTPTEQPTPEGLSDPEYVEWLYKNILCRKGADPEGLHHWCQALNQGMPRQQLEEHFRKIIEIDNKKKDMLANPFSPNVTFQEKIWDIVKEAEDLKVK